MNLVNPPTQHPQPAPPAAPTGTAGAFASYRHRWLGPLLFILLLARLVMWLGLLGILAPSRADLSFPEGALVARALDVAHGQPPYHDWRQWPHSFAPYGPLTYYTVGWLARATGGAVEYRQVYVTGRLCSLACLLGCLALVYALGRRLGLTRRWAILAVALAPEWSNLLIYGASYRPDAPRTLFALLALWLMTQGPARLAGGRQVARLCAVLACLYVSLWFKPTAWAATALAGWWLWRGLGLRRGMAIYAGFLVGGLGLFFALDCHWGGLLRLNMIDSLDNGFSLGMIKGLLTETPLVALLATFGGAAAALAAVRREPDPGRRLLLAAVPLTLLTSLGQGLKLGADLNYLLEAWLLTSVAAVSWASRLWHGEWRPARLAYGRAAGLGEGLCWLLAVPVLYSLYVHGSNGRTLWEAHLDTWKPFPIEDIVHRQTGPVLAANPFIALAAPPPAGVLDHYQFRVLWERGQLDPHPLLERIERCEFALIVLYEDSIQMKPGLPPAEQSLYCAEFTPLLLKNYYVRNQIKPFLVLAPRR